MRSKFNWLNKFLCIIFFFFIGCTAYDVYDKNFQLPVKEYPGYDEFVRANTFPYAISANHEADIRKKYYRLVSGMSQADVKKILGVPDYSENLCTKQPPIKFKGTMWTYTFIKQDPNIVNMIKDIEINLFFNPNRKLLRIYSNVEGLKSTK